MCNATLAVTVNVWLGTGPAIEEPREGNGDNPRQRDSHTLTRNLDFPNLNRRHIGIWAKQGGAWERSMIRVDGGNLVVYSSFSQKVLKKGDAVFDLYDALVVEDSRWPYT